MKLALAAEVASNTAQQAQSEFDIARAFRRAGGPVAMSMINVALDTSKLEKWAAELSARGMRNALRRAVDQSARAARKIAIDVIAKDIGVAKSKIAAAVPKVVTTRAGGRRLFTPKRREGVPRQDCQRRKVYRVQDEQRAFAAQRHLRRDASNSDGAGRHSGARDVAEGSGQATVNAFAGRSSESFRL
jgi:hypothetical protein